MNCAKCGELIGHCEDCRLRESYPEWTDWDDLEDDGPMDHEEQLDEAMDRAFPRVKP